MICCARTLSIAPTSGRSRIAIVHPDDRRRELAQGGLVPLQRLDVGRDVGVDGERHVEEDDLLDARERQRRLAGGIEAKSFSRRSSRYFRYAARYHLGARPMRSCTAPTRRRSST